MQKRIHKYMMLKGCLDCMEADIERELSLRGGSIEAWPYRAYVKDGKLIVEGP